MKTFYLELVSKAYIWGGRSHAHVQFDFLTYYGNDKCSKKLFTYQVPFYIFKNYNRTSIVLVPHLFSFFLETLLKFRGSWIAFGFL